MDFYSFSEAGEYFREFPSIAVAVVDLPPGIEAMLAPCTDTLFLSFRCHQKWLLGCNLASRNYLVSTLHNLVRQQRITPGLPSMVFAVPEGVALQPHVGWTFARCYLFWKGNDVY